MKIQVKLISHLLLHIIGELVWPTLLQLVRKDAPIVLRHVPELIVLVLQSQVCKLHFVNDLFSNLRVERNPLQSRLARHFFIVTILARAEPIIVEIDEDELALEPVFDL